jgi:hypothetical protein
MTGDAVRESLEKLLFKPDRMTSKTYQDTYKLADKLDMTNQEMA